MNINLEGKKVLVTGADGFMGSHLTDRLVEMGAKVSVYLRGNSVSGTTKYTLKNIKHLEDKLESILTGDIASSDSISLISKNKYPAIKQAKGVSTKNVRIAERVAISIKINQQKIKINL